MVVRASDLQQRGRRFESQSLYFTLQLWGVHARVPLFTKQYKLGPAIGWEVTIGLASHWPCVTDSMSPTGSMTAQGAQGDEHTAEAPFRVLWHLYSLPYNI